MVNIVTEKGRTLSIGVETGATFGPQNLPLVRGTLETPAHIAAAIGFETDKDCKGFEVEIIFKAATRTKVEVQTENTLFSWSEQVFQNKKWTLPIEQKKPGTIKQGKYHQRIQVAIDPLWPSSMSTYCRGIMSDTITVRLMGYKFGALKALMTAEQEIWVQNSTMPRNLLEHQNQPWTAQNTWVNESLPMTLSIPSEILMVRQTVPITVHVGPFRDGSKSGQVPIIMGAYITLLETVGIRAQLQRNTTKTTKKLMTIALNDGWPQQEEWERTVHVTLPKVEDMCTSMQSKWVDVTHTLLLKMRLRLNTTKDNSGIEYETQMNVQIVHPRMTDDDMDVGDVLPPYQGSQMQDSVAVPQEKTAIMVMTS